MTSVLPSGDSATDDATRARVTVTPGGSMVVTRIGDAPLSADGRIDPHTANATSRPSRRKDANDNRRRHHARRATEGSASLTVQRSAGDSSGSSALDTNRSGHVRAP